MCICISCWLDELLLSWQPLKPVEKPDYGNKDRTDEFLRSHNFK